VAIERGKNKGKPNIVVVDTAREEMIGFADDQTRDLFVNGLLERGAEYKKL